MIKMETVDAAFSFKGGMLPMTVLELASADLDQIKSQLAGKVSQSPAFFQNTPVVISVEHVRSNDPLPLEGLCALCREYKLLPMAFRGGSDQVKQAVWAMGMAWFPPQPARPQPVETLTAPEPKPEARQVPEEVELSNGRIFRGTVRSGQQVSAPLGDLVVVGAVNAGAEVLAAGSIHVYGPLRGRALAGIHGHNNVGIFCHELHAELISIAGNYKRLEDIPPGLINQHVQVKLSDDQLEISPLS
ncbi:septum site-determining protein MinC [Zymobacter sp. IVIA_12111.31 C1]|uniref:septum site-determining protein MinC n=1 Tax=Zymobacter sp. IVIA_12111.31 C1 TaxID=3394854 RepID=UPI0039C28769